MLSSPPPNNPADIIGLIESVRSIWFNSERTTEVITTDEITTTNTAAVTLESFTLEDETTIHFHSVIVGDKASFELAATVYRDGGIAIIQGQTVIHTAGSLTATFDVNGNDVRIRVSGIGRWRASTKLMRL